MDKNTTQNAAPEVKKQGFLNLFLAGGKKGLNIWFNNMIPSIILGGLILAIIEETGLIDIIGNVMGPVMGIFGLPGEAAVLWVTSMVNMSVGILGAIPLIEAGTMTGEHAAILLAMIMALIPPAKMSRLAGASGADGKMIGIGYGLTFVCSILCGLAMRVVLMFI